MFFGVNDSDICLETGFEPAAHLEFVLDASDEGGFGFWCWFAEDVRPLGFWED